ncbi:GntR family transcriptional regulator [Rhizobium sp. NLR17b]|uniref:GntR family transcriptional regulator n=1 Tax=Rhizobium sp. NLR17b TaxID=2731114 RepID=UPI00287F6221|nr:GntR family transcriptional regulator [Rhizobium sp. NLR17b]
MDPRQSLSVQVYERIREAIVSLWFKPGEAIVEKAIAEQLGLSRTPVREAVMRLSDEGLIDIFRHSGTFVAPIRMQDVVEGQMVRVALELAAIERAVERYTPEFADIFGQILQRQGECAKWNDYEGFHVLDEEFHRTISLCSGTLRTWRIIVSAKAQVDRVRRLGLRAPGQFEQILNEHTAIADGIRRGDAALAKSALRHHLEEVFQSIQTLLAQNPEYFSESEERSQVPRPRSRSLTISTSTSFP